MIKKSILSISIVLTVGANLLTSTVYAKEMTGKEIAFDRKLGNCLSCHMIQGGELTGNIAPPLIAMQARFPNKEKLKAQIWDASVANSHSFMPLFGKHAILTEQQIDKVTNYIYSL